MVERISKIDLGFVPEAAVSGAVLLQSENSTYLIFNAMKMDANNNLYDDAGLAVCEFPGCIITKFGYPNDEAWSAIPRTRGIAYEVCEVFDSEWNQEITRLNRYAFPNTPESTKRHFLLLFHDSSFECLADDIKAQLTREPFSVVMAHLSKHIESE
jgi:hypothetical protein